MKTFEEWRYSSTIFDLGSKWMRVVKLIPLLLYPRGKGPTGKEAGWAPEPFWTLWRRESVWIKCGHDINYSLILQYTQVSPQYLCQRGFQV
jgi:hypothetical protein